MSRSKHSKDEKVAILNLYYNGQYSLNELASMFHISGQTLVDWKVKQLFKKIETSCHTRLLIRILFFKRNYEKIQYFFYFCFEKMA